VSKPIKVLPISKSRRGLLDLSIELSCDAGIVMAHRPGRQHRKLQYRNHPEAALPAAIRLPKAVAWATKPIAGHETTLEWIRNISDGSRLVIADGREPDPSGPTHKRTL
jgi:hypothetical protein